MSKRRQKRRGDRRSLGREERSCGPEETWTLGGAPEQEVGTSPLCIPQSPPPWASLTCKLRSPIKAAPCPTGTDVAIWAWSPPPGEAPAAQPSASERSAVLSGDPFSGWRGGESEGWALTPECCGPTDLQAADGEEAPSAHQRVIGAAQVSAGETLFAPGGTRPEDGNRWPASSLPHLGLPG